ncbi:MAG: hypothetical protein ACOYMN_02070 [Roseimicrobium sp.]
MLRLIARENLVLRCLAALRVVVAIALTTCLSQCRCVDACIQFFQEHSSRGTNARLSSGLPVRPLTVEEFVAENRHRGLPEETLRFRFRVADANHDGWLTAQEIREHRARAALRKQGGQQ